jgi:hypothetical protein
MGGVPGVKQEEGEASHAWRGGGEEERTTGRMATVTSEDAPPFVDKVKGGG